MVYTISKEQMARDLGRPLTEYEELNFDGLLASAKDQLQFILKTLIDGEDNTPRLYDINPGYSQIFIDPFISDDSHPLTVTVSDKPINDLAPVYFDDLNAPWFNSIIFDCPMGAKRIKVQASWGYGDVLPKDLELLWAQMFDIVSTGTQSNNEGDGVSRGAIKSETILTHSVTYDTSQTALASFINENVAVIARYARPFIGDISGGWC